MTLLTSDRLSIVKYRIEKAHKTFSEAEFSFNNGFATLAMQRLYYSVYYMASALLINNGVLAKTHKGVINQINRLYIFNNLISIENGKIFNQLFQNRNMGDYNDCFDFTLEEVSQLMEPTKNFIQSLELMIILKKI